MDLLKLASPQKSANNKFTNNNAKENLAQSWINQFLPKKENPVLKKIWIKTNLWTKIFGQSIKFQLWMLLKLASTTKGFPGVMSILI